MSAFVDIMRPRQKALGYIVDVLAIMSGVLLLVGSSYVALPLSWTPVPITLQTFVIFLLGACLGSKRGTLAVLLYLIEGVYGMPFFASGGAGWGAILGPTGGYLVGFGIATFCIGWLLEKGCRKQFLTTGMAMLLGLGIIYTCGTLWLALFVGFPSAIMLGMVPFFAADLIKLIMAATLVSQGWKLIKF